MIIDILLFVLPYGLSLGLGFVVGFMSRNSAIDRLNADLFKMTKERDGVQIRTSRTEEVQEPVRSIHVREAPPRTRTAPNRTGHTATRTEPLPTGVRYAPAAEENDEPMSDAEYAELNGRMA